MSAKTIQVMTFTQFIAILTAEDYPETPPLLLFTKNLGRLWLAYTACTDLQGDFCMLQFISVNSRHFTQSSKDVGFL